MRLHVAQRQPGSVNVRLSSVPWRQCRHSTRGGGVVRINSVISNVRIKQATEDSVIGRRHLASRVIGHTTRTAASAQPCTSTGSVVRTLDNDTVRWGSYVSLKSDLAKAVDESISKILASIGTDADPELAVVFVSAAHGKDAAGVVKLLRDRIPSLQHIYGCSSSGVIGGSETGPHEVEGGLGLSLALGRLPGVQVTLKHTLRSGIPTEDCGPDKWEKFLGIQRVAGQNLHFMLLAEPNFNQIQGIRQGLDAAFPLSAKIGGVVSAGTAAGCKARHMFCWSAGGTARAGSSSSSSSSSSTSNSSTSSSSSSREGGASSAAVRSTGAAESAPGALARVREDAGQRGRQEAGQQESWLTRGLRNIVDTYKAASSSSSASSSGAASGPSDALPGASSSGGEEPEEEMGGAAGAGRKQRRARRIPRRSRGRPRREPREEEGDDNGSSQGVFRYGAVLMMVQGNLQVDVLVSEGARFLSEKTWRVALAEDNCVYAVVDDEQSSDGELQEPVDAVLGHIQELVASGQLPTDTMAEVLGSFALAVGPPADYLREQSGREALQREDFTPVEVTIDQQQGALLLSCDVTPGVRLRLVVRDEQGAKSDLQEQLLAYKRQELGAVMQGRSPPPAFAAFLLTDVERGADYYGAEGGPNVESNILASYLPMPLSGAFLNSQFAWHQREQATLEVHNHAVVAILRASSATHSLGIDEPVTDSSEGDDA